MNINKFLVSFLICCFINSFNFTYCQSDISLNDVKKIDEVVGEFTGSLNLSIPIATASSGSLVVPLGVSYIGNGLKPNQAAGPIGLGWALNDVGVIYKHTLGMEDTYRDLEGKELCYGFPKCDLNEYLDDSVDGAYDIYSYNILGVTGKFVYDPLLNECISLNKSNVRIERTGITQFRVTLTNGNIVELSRNWEEETEDYKQPSVWFADRIFSYDKKDTIKLSYISGEYMYLTLKDNHLIKENAFNTSEPSHEIDNSEHFIKFLKKIEGRNDSIVLSYSSRLDLTDFVNAKCTQIEYKSDNICVSSIFVTDYFENVSSQKTHLRLKEILTKKCGSAEEVLPAYKFEYYGNLNSNQSQFAPEKTTTGIDAWGYYNGMVSNPIYNMTSQNISGGGANRSSILEATKCTALKKVTTPLGGTSTYEYQQNSYVSDIGQPIYLFQLETCISGANNCVGNYIMSSSNITVTNHQIQTGSLYLELDNIGGLSTPQLFFEIRNSSNVTIHTISLNGGSSSPYLNIELKDIKNSSGNPILIANNVYKFVLSTYNSRGKAYCEYANLGTENLCGGLRVSKIINSNGNSAFDIITNYNYEFGVQYQTPKFFETLAGRSIYFNRTLKDENLLMDYNIGYRKVTISNPNLGKTVKIFKSSFSKQFGLGNTRIITDKLSEGVGLLLSQETYNNLNALIKKDSFEYEKTTYTNLPINHIYFARFGTVLSGFDYYGYSYQLNTYSVKPKRVLNYYYSILTTTTEYNYSHSYTTEPSLIKVTTGNGNITETFIDYTPNFWQNVNVKNYFISKNIIIPYTFVVYENGKPIKGSTQDFAFYSSAGIFGVSSTPSTDIVRKSKLFVGQYDGVSNSPVGTYEEIAYHEYTNDGFIKNQQQINWPSTTYLYDGRERLTSINFNGFESSKTYHGKSNLILRKTNVDGTYAEFEYDGLLRLKKETAYPSGVISEYSYSFYDLNNGLNSQKIKITFPVVSGSSVNIIENITYLDKLGRKICTIAIKGSPNLKDVITSFEYDNLGRLVKAYEPIETIYNDGTYIAPGSTNITSGQLWKYTETKYEASPLSRIIENIAPDWFPTKYEYGLNINDDYVSGYLPNKLIKNTFIDGNNNRKVTFTDFNGRLICERQYNSVNYTSNWRDTYYVYDNKNRVIKVLPPGTNITNIPLERIFEYKYDAEDKVIEKKIPGKGWIKYKYNNKDLLAAEQDANNSLLNRWLIYSYDINGRLLKTGYYDGAVPNLENPVFNNLNTFAENIYGISILEKDKIKTQKIKILGTTADFLTTTYNYDSRGRVFSYVKNNHKNLAATDLTTLGYDNADNLLSKEFALSAFPDGSNTIHNLNYGIVFDHRGRILEDQFSYENYGSKVVANYSYNHKNELIKVRQGKHNATTYLQDIDYKYRTNGLLERVNEPLGYAATGDLWYMEYYYNNNIPSTGSESRKNGEISNIKWQRRSSTVAVHGYKYSMYGDLLNVDYSDYDWSNNLIQTNKFDETFAYLSNGFLTSASRKDNNGSNLDNLTYNYVSNSVRLNRVNDTSGNSLGFNQNGQSSTGNIFTYDANGNVKSDAYRGVTNINYNHLNLPILIDKSGGNKIELTYDALGNVLTRKRFINNVLSETYDYISSLEFKNNTLSIIKNTQGYLERLGSGNFKHRYVMKDHLGNTRIVYCDDNASGDVSHSEILEENHYYAYGMEYVNSSYINGSGFNYKFNGLERLESNHFDFAFYRGLDPVLGSWLQVDPFAESFYNMSPYCAMGNNPILYSDPDGGIAHIVIGAAIGGFGNLIYQGLSGNLSSPGDGLAAFGIGFVAGGVGAATGGASLAAMGVSGSLGSAIVAGAASGAASGASAGFIQNTLNSLYFQNSRLGDALYSGLKGAVLGALGGAVIGGVVGGLSYKPIPPPDLKPPPPPVEQPSSMDDLIDAALEVGNPVAKLPDGQIFVQNGPGGSWTKYIPQQAAAKGGFDVVGAFKNAISTFNGGNLTNAGRAVTKHPKYFGFNSLEALQKVYRSPEAINNLASSRLKDVLRNGTLTTGAGGRYPNGWATYTLPNGNAASWNLDGSFIGFRGIR